MIRSSNPALKPGTFSNPSFMGLAGSDTEVMTIKGTSTKTLILLGVVLLTSFWTWSNMMEAFRWGQTPSMTYLWIGLIGGMVLAMVTIFKKTWAPYTAPLYAAFEGLVLGGISVMFEMQFPGIVSQAVFATFGVFAVMLWLYRSKVLRATPKFKLGVMAATGGIMFVYMISWVLSFFGTTIPFIHEGGLLGIGFSLFVVGIAALNLILDFDLIEEGARQGAPKFMEWYGAFALLVTLIWLYLEILRLLAKMQRRR